MFFTAFRIGTESFGGGKSCRRSRGQGKMNTFSIDWKRDRSGRMATRISLSLSSVIDYFPSRRWRSWRLSADRKTESRYRFLFRVLFLVVLFVRRFVVCLGDIFRENVSVDVSFQFYFITFRMKVQFVLDLHPEISMHWKDFLALDFIISIFCYCYKVALKKNFWCGKWKRNKLFTVL